jgi:hypothetical protein
MAAASPRPALSGRKDFKAAAVARTSTLLHSVIVWPASGAFNLPVCVCVVLCVCACFHSSHSSRQMQNSELSPKIHTSASKAPSWPPRVRWPFSSPMLQNISLCWPCHLPHPSRRTQPLEHGAAQHVCPRASETLSAPHFGVGRATLPTSTPAPPLPRQLTGWVSPLSHSEEKRQA